MKIFSILLISFLVLEVFSQEFFGMMLDPSCERDSDCIDSNLCRAGECHPISSFRKCSKIAGIEYCGREYLCRSGVCRYIRDIFPPPKHSFVPMTCTHPLECPDNRKCVNGQCV
ncbi:hypothetical protein L3Y34_016176 [Caenorhabditis briggsae]|uniref:Uncharacterized protein n=1 Tax=Caenorhabditis briggsae TaxID=6238 RepID=A0AAE9IZZ2_CAEBR|nr:hypothetical protein L3Y34_016176 [Caenorhabditis briggsae]